MSKHSLLPEGEHLRMALRWLSDNAPISRATIDEAGRRFDLSPLEEDFLLSGFVQRGKTPGHEI